MEIQKNITNALKYKQKTQNILQTHCNINNNVNNDINQLEYQQFHTNIKDAMGLGPTVGGYTFTKVFVKYF